MAIFLIQPDADGNCCDCNGRTDPCESCGGGCGVCAYECLRTGTQLDHDEDELRCPPVAFSDDICISYNHTVPCESGPTIITAHVQVRLVITELTAGVETTAYVFFSDDTSHEFIFTPVSDTYTTEYVDVPFPALDAPEISVTGCTVACGSCECALIAPPQRPPYASLAEAQAAIGTWTSNCIGWVEADTSSNLTSFTVTQGVNQIVIVVVANYASEPSSSQYPRPWISVSLNEGTIVSVNHSADAVAYLHDCNGILLDTVSNNGSFIAVPSDSTYYIETFPQWPSIPSTPSLTTILSVSNLIANPVIVRYNDSGTIRQLEACPKLLLPPLAKCTGAAWYESLSAAQSVLANGSLISNCVAYQTSSATGTTNSFSVSSANPSNIALLKSNASLPDTPTSVLLSVSLLTGNTLSLDWNFTWTQGTPGIGPAMIATMSLTDCAGTDLDDESSVFGVSPGSGSASGTLSLTAPYTGNFNIIVGVSKSIGLNITFLTAEFTATLSSPSMIVNPIQALYNVGLDCPARLDCS